MDLGFETIGNATLVVHDREPVLVTDPWVEGSAYFGSWGLSHTVPPEQLAAIDQVGAVVLPRPPRPPEPGLAPALP